VTCSPLASVQYEAESERTGVVEQERATERGEMSKVVQREEEMAMERGRDVKREAARRHGTWRQRDATGVPGSAFNLAK
jgi:hypothetical protein